MFKELFISAFCCETTMCNNLTKVGNLDTKAGHYDDKKIIANSGGSRISQTMERASTPAYYFANFFPKTA